LNRKRKDKGKFLFDRYFKWFFVLFEKLSVVAKNYNPLLKNIVFIATSAGEINQIIPLISKTHLWQKYNIIILYTSETALLALKKIDFPFSGHYLYPDFPFFHLIFFLKLKPVKIFFIEHEIWPGFLIFANLFKTGSYFLQAKYNLSAFRLNLLTLYIHKKFTCIVPQDQNEYLLFRNFFNRQEKKPAITDHCNLKFLQKFLPQPFEKKLERNLIITFASTHPEDEIFFIPLIPRLSSFFLSYFAHVTIFVVPRHPERASEIKNHIIDFLSNPSGIDNIIREKTSITNLKEYSGKTDLRTKIRPNPGYKTEIIVGDMFNMLNSIYSQTHLCFMGATFFWHGGGHNILEPLYYNNIIIVGPYLKNLKKEFEIFCKNGFGLVFDPVYPTKINGNKKTKYKQKYSIPDESFFKNENYLFKRILFQLEKYYKLGKSRDNLSFDNSQNDDKIFIPSLFIENMGEKTIHIIQNLV